MSEKRNFLVSQAEKPLVVVEARDEESALARAKGLGHVLNFSASLSMTATPIREMPKGVPVFKSEYFELLGFRS
jgi:hypothetical protein